MITGPIEMEDADLSVLSPTLPTPDIERRDASFQERSKRDGTGINCRAYVYHLPVQPLKI